jgi:ABC-type nitrate/sulfonate/bicarbonate transport system substrate-binding protein
MLEEMMGLKRLLILLIFFITACTSETAEENPLKLAGVNYLGDLPTLVASKNNLFEKNHLTMDVSFTDSGKQNLDDLRAGRVDFALMSSTPFILDKLANVGNEPQDNEPVILGNLLHSTHLNQILTRQGRGIETVNDLKGGKVGLAKGTNSEYLWWLYSVFYQVTPGSVELIDLPVSQLGEALINGDVDAIVVWQPWTNRFMQQYSAQLEQVEGGHVYSAKWLLVTTRKMVRENPFYCQQVLKAYAEAIRLIQADTENVMQIYSVHASKDQIAVTNYQPGLHQLNLNWALIAELHQGIQWAKLHHFPGSDQPSDVISWFAPEPLQTIKPFLVKIPTAASPENLP